MRTICGNDFEVTYGMYNIREEREDAKHDFGYLVEDIRNLKKCYVTLGFHLNEFQKNKYYEDFGFENFESFCQANFSLTKSEISRCISVWWNFSESDGGYVRKMWLDKKYEKYNYSQLVEMLSVKEELRKNITPDMSVKKIREYKQQLKDKKEDVATSQLETNEMQTIKGNNKETYAFENSEKADETVNKEESIVEVNSSCDLSVFEYLQTVSINEFAEWLINDGKQMLEIKKSYLQVLSWLKTECKSVI